MRKLCALLIGVLMLSGSAFATDYQWTNFDTGTNNGFGWFDNTNWSPIGVPSSADDTALIETGGTIDLSAGLPSIGGRGTGTITAGEIIVDNGSRFDSWYIDITFNVLDDCGQSGDFIYLANTSRAYQTRLTMNIDGHYTIPSAYWYGNYDPPHDDVVNLYGDNKAIKDQAYYRGKQVDYNIYGTIYDNGSRGDYINNNILTVKSGGQILARPDGSGSEWQYAQFVFEDGQANLPAIGSNVNFQYNCMDTDNGTENLAVTGGVMYPQDVAVGGDYWGGAAKLGIFRWVTKGGDIGVGRDLRIVNHGGYSRGEFRFSTADNDGGADANLLIYRDFLVDSVPLLGNEYYGIELNDSTVQIGRDFVIGGFTSGYYGYVPRNQARVDLGSATIRIGDDLTISRLTADAIAAWNQGTSTIIMDGNGMGGALGTQVIETWGADSPLHSLIVDAPGGTVQLRNYLSPLDNVNTSLYLTGDLKILNGTFDQNNVLIQFNGEHALQVDDNANVLDTIELLADAVVNLGSDVSMADLLMGTNSELYLQGFTLLVGATEYSGEGQWSVGDGTIIGVVQVPGDANGDGKVDGADLAIWQQNYDPLGSAGNNTFALGDWNEDGKIDGADLALWQQNYDPLGSGGLDGLGASVPEPATLLLLGTGLVGAIGAARRRRTK